jgi:hypothetical protein
VQAPESKDLILQGRAYCSLTVGVETHTLAKVAKILVGVGQAVSTGQALLLMDLLPVDAAKMIERADKGPAIQAQELLIRQHELKLKQVERSMLEMQKLSEINLAPKSGMPELLEQKSYLLSQIAIAKQLLTSLQISAAEDLKVMADELGYPVASGSKPRTLIVRAKQDGIVLGIETNVSPGAEVKGKVMTLGVMDPMIIRGQVHESETGRLKAGEMATITLDSDKDQPAMNATLTSVSWAAQDSSLSAPAYYLFELQVPNPSLIIRDGTKVQVTFKAKNAQKAEASAPQPAGAAAPAVSTAPAGSTASAVPAAQKTPGAPASARQAPAPAPKPAAPVQGAAKAPPAAHAAPPTAPQ